MRTYTGSGTGPVATMVTTSSMCKCAAVLMHAQQLLPLVLISPSSAFVASPPAGRSMPSPMTHSSSKATTTIMTMARDMQGCDIATVAAATGAKRGTATNRGEFLSRLAHAAGAGVGLAAVFPAQPADALVKGNAPPAGYNKKRGSGSGNGEREAEISADANAGGDGPSQTFSVTTTGVRFKDLKIGSGEEVKPFEVVDIRYRVEKLGKRSYDGISGETQSVFSLGYGDDDDKEGDVLTVPLGQGRLVSAVDEAVLGMRVGGVRRVAVRPERGWKKQDPKCATEIDMGVMSGVPGAALAKIEDCIDLALEPRPMGYGATRRMARRFDETLIVEVEMIASKESSGRIF